MCVLDSLNITKVLCTHEAGDERQVVEAEGEIDLKTDRHEEHSQKECSERCNVSLHLYHIENIIPT